MPPRKKKGGAITIQKDLLKIDLVTGQIINTSPGSLIYMRGDIEKGEVSMGSFGNAFARSFAGENFFLTKYIGGPQGGSIALSLSFPGDIIQITLQPNESYRISKGCFIASTDNIKISATSQWKGIIGIGQEEGVFMPLLTCIGPNDGTVWIGGFGSFERHELANASDVLTVDNGIFLACPNEMSYKIVQLGKSLWSSFAGAEGFGMEFKGPGTVYTQSKNFNDFFAMMSVGTQAGTKNIAQAASETIQTNIGEGVGNTLTSWFSQEGGKKKTQKKTKTRA